MVDPSGNSSDFGLKDRGFTEGLPNLNTLKGGIQSRLAVDVLKDFMHKFETLEFIPGGLYAKRKPKLEPEDEDDSEDECDCSKCIEFYKCSKGEQKEQETRAEIVEERQPETGQSSSDSGPRKSELEIAIEEVGNESTSHEVRKSSHVSVSKTKSY